MSRTRVLVIDDSPTMRAVIKTVLRGDPSIVVVGEAGDAYEAREKIKQLNPDVLTLDIEMPKMNGLDFLEKVMALRPMPVIMLSSLTKKGAVNSVEALRMGAFECVAKPTSSDFMTELAILPGLVKAAAASNLKNISTQKIPQADTSNFQPNRRVIAIGSSTGGVEALLQILSTFPENCPPTLITQHMPAYFLGTFAERLDRTVAPSVSVAYDGAPLRKGQVYLAPGGDQHLSVSKRSARNCRVEKGAPVSGHCPSVDVLFESVAALVGSQALGVILTGIGRDGAKGLQAIRDAGGCTLGQDEKSSIVYGMPRAAFELGAVEKQVSLPLMGRAILSLCSAEKPSERQKA